MPATRRADRRRELEARIVAAGRRHLAEDGAAALSLRAVARDLGLVSSAVYRYVESRDELLTLLLVQAYDELGDAVDAALAQSAGRPWDERVVAAGLAFRAWAVADPASYALLYGSPVPGYEAAVERTTEPGTRVVAAVLRLVAEGVATGDVRPERRDVSAPASPLDADLDRVAAEAGLDIPTDVMGRAVLLWATLVGATSLEVFGQYGRDTFGHPAALLELQLRHALAVVRGA